MKLHWYKRFLALCVSALLSGVTVNVYSETQGRGLSYSPDHWPNRWSTAIRQKQNGKFPARKKQHHSGTKPSRDYSDVVSEEDLFHSPSDSRYGHRNERHFRGKQAGYRYLRDARRLSRDAAVAYNDMANMATPYGGYGMGMRGAPAGIAMDPVLGHPGMGIPIMPGTPLGYPLGPAPFGLYPYAGYPYGIGGWNPPFGVW